jgi:predicted DCC family thiol-disulfide oxidoreductase YuxK
VRIDRTDWHVVAVAPHDLDVSFLARSANFAPGEAVYDSCFYVHALDYHWHRIDRQPFTLQRATDGGATFFYDGGCPICVREVGHWKGLLAAAAAAAPAGAAPPLVLHDINGPETVGKLGTHFGVSVEEAMARAHAIDESGTLRTGISAFVVVWSRLPYWRWLAGILRTVPAVLSAAELAYGVWADARQHLPRTADSAAGTTRAGPGGSCRYVPGQKGCG